MCEDQLERSGWHGERCGSTWEGSKEVAGISNERIRIRMEAYDHTILDQSAKDIVDTAKRTEAIVQQAHRAKELCQVLAAVAQYLFVRNHLRELGGEGESRRRAISPVSHHRLGRNPVVGGIHFDGVKMPGVSAQEVRRRRAGRIKRSHPVLTGPARSSEAQMGHTGIGQGLLSF